MTAMMRIAKIRLMGSETGIIFSSIYEQNLILVRFELNCITQYLEYSFNSSRLNFHSQSRVFGRAITNMSIRSKNIDIFS